MRYTINPRTLLSFYFNSYQDVRVGTRKSLEVLSEVLSTKLMMTVNNRFRPSHSVYNS